MFIMAKLFSAHGYVCESQQSCDRVTFVRLLRHPSRRCETPILMLSLPANVKQSGTAYTRCSLVRMPKLANEVFIFPLFYS